MKYTAPEAVETPLNGVLDSSHGDYQGSMIIGG
jgi:hypothetical protein